MKTVNFIEAVNSGNSFRPTPSAEHGYDWMFIGDCENMFKGKCLETMTDLQFFNSQFELKEKSINITESEFDIAWDNLIIYESKVKSLGLFHALKKQLGF